MPISKLPKYVDIRHTIRRSGRYPIAKVGNLKGVEAKDTLVIHHSMTPQSAKGSTPYAFANTHIDTNGWHGCAYPIVIMPDGTIYQTDDFDRRTYHAGNTNDRSIGICVVGDFRTEGANEKPTEDQKLSLYLVVKELKEDYSRIRTTLGHQECPGYSWKNCPGNTWRYKDVIAGKGVQLPAPKPPSKIAPKKPKALPATYKIQDGDTYWSISKGLDISVDELKKYNPKVDETNLKIGQIIRLKPAPAPKTKTVTVLVPELFTYNSASWSDKGAIVRKGEVFTIANSLTVDGSKMYKLKSGAYITANPKYVLVK